MLAMVCFIKLNSSGFFAALNAFFHQPKYVGAFAIVLIAVLAGLIYFGANHSHDELAELRSMYRESRPNESRISQFDYAPVSQLRGAPAPSDERRLRRIELSLIEQTEKHPSAETYHALGVFIDQRFISRRKCSKHDRLAGGRVGRIVKLSRNTRKLQPKLFGQEPGAAGNITRSGGSVGFLSRGKSACPG